MYRVSCTKKALSDSRKFLRLQCNLLTYYFLCERTLKRYTCNGSLTINKHGANELNLIVTRKSVTSSYRITFERYKFIIHLVSRVHKVINVI